MEHQVVAYGRAGVRHPQRSLLGLALLERLLQVAHHGPFDRIEVDFDGFAAGVRFGSGLRHLLGLGPGGGPARVGGESAPQSIDQAVECRIG